MKTILLMAAVLFANPQANAGSDLEYFQQFLYLKEDIGNDPDFPEYQYRYLMAINTEIELPSGKAVSPEIRLYLHAGGAFTMHYRENVLMPRNPDGTRPFMPGRCRVIEGNWSVPGSELLIGELATGSRNFGDNRNRVGFRLIADIDQAGMAGKEVILDYGYSNVGLDGPMFCF